MKVKTRKAKQMVYLTFEEHEKLRALAEADHRDLGLEVVWLIEAEEARRAAKAKA